MASIGLFGCGGIGVEFLHSLLHSTATKIILVDFDTVELSNLSRQFIFTQDDIGTSKVAACERFCRKNFPKTEIIALNAHLEDIELGNFQNLDFIVAALDNAEARNVLQLRALASNAIYIDAGTAGLSGSIRVFRPFSIGVTEYRCLPKGEYTRPPCYCCSTESQQAVLPVCTLRSRPENPKHCIAFGLALGRGMLGDGELAEVKTRGRDYALVELLGNHFSEPEARVEPCVMNALNTFAQFNPSELFFDRDNLCDVEFVYAVALLRAK